MLNAHKGSNNSKPTIHIAVSSATGNRIVTSPREPTSLSQIKIRLETRIIFSPLTLLHPRACVRSAINPSTRATLDRGGGRRGARGALAPPPPPTTTTTTTFLQTAFQTKSRKQMQTCSQLKI